MKLTQAELISMFKSEYFLRLYKKIQVIHLNNFYATSEKLRQLGDPILNFKMNLIIKVQDFGCL